MVASKGGVSFDKAAAMPTSERRSVLYALAQCHGADIDWDSGEIRPPKSVQSSVRRAVGDPSESMSFGAK